MWGGELEAGKVFKLAFLVWSRSFLGDQEVGQDQQIREDVGFVQSLTKQEEINMVPGNESE